MGKGGQNQAKICHDTKSPSAQITNASQTIIKMGRPISPWLRKPLYEEKKQSLLLNDSPAGTASTCESYGSMSPDNGLLPSSCSTNTINNELERHLTLFDLVVIGVGSTVGSGIFVLCGLIAKNYAGPATFISWSIAGLAACLSGCCYAELAGRIPSAGSAYRYVYTAMGELPAFVVAACLSTEYILASAAVARSWGDKIMIYLQTEFHGEDNSHMIAAYLDPGYNISPGGFFVSTACAILLLNGVKESKNVAVFFTVTKVILVTFMTVMGFTLMNTTNISPLIPPEYGWSGVFRGATSSFFGYLGYDSVCCVAGEAINPRRDVPRAVMLTIGSVTVIYIMASFAMTGMEPYQNISDVSGFPEAFQSNGVHWAAQISAFGEVFTLPIVVLLMTMVQPRLQYALAQDGLIPPWFAKMDSTGNLYNGTMFAGGIVIFTATFIPFLHLNDMISASVLIAFSMTDSSLILLRQESPKESPFLLEKFLCVFNIASFLSGLLLTHYSADSYLSKYMSMMMLTVAIVSCLGIWIFCPSCSRFGGKRSIISNSDDDESSYFKSPLYPFLPCAGMFINWYLICQMELTGILLLIAYLVVAVLYYFHYGAHNSVGNNGGWAKSGVKFLSIDLENVKQQHCNNRERSTSLTDFILT